MFNFYVIGKETQTSIKRRGGHTSHGSKSCVVFIPHNSWERKGIHMSYSSEPNSHDSRSDTYDRKRRNKPPYQGNGGRLPIALKADVRDHGMVTAGRGNKLICAAFTRGIPMCGDPIPMIGSQGENLHVGALGADFPSIRSRCRDHTLIHSRGEANSHAVVYQLGELPCAVPFPN